MIKKTLSFFSSDFGSVCVTPDWQSLSFDFIQRLFILSVNLDFMVCHYSCSKLTDWASEPQRGSQRVGSRESGVIYSQGGSKGFLAARARVTYTPRN